MKTAELNKVKALSFRTITDHAEDKMASELKDNWEKALIILYQVLDILLSEGGISRILANI